MVEARYRNEQAELPVLDIERGVICLQWNTQELELMFARGDIRAEEFLQPGRYGMDLLVRHFSQLTCGGSVQIKRENGLSFRLSPKR